MINYVLKDDVVKKLNNYLKTIEKDEIGYYIKTENIEKYIYSNTFNFSNILKKYIIIVNELLENNFNNELFLLNDENKKWNISIVHDEIFFENIFVLENIIFIRFSKIIDIIENSVKNINIDFLKEMVKARIYTIQYYNFEKWKLHIEKNNNCIIVKKINFIKNNEFKILKNINTSFLDDYYCIHGEDNDINYIIVKNIIDSNIKYLPYYNTKIIKVNENIIDFDEIIAVDIFDNFIDYFEEYNIEIINNIFK